MSCCTSKDNKYTPAADKKISIEKSNEVYEIVNTYDIDPGAFIQGMYYKNNCLYISTGLVGRSSLRIYDLKQKSEINNIQIPNYFCEGITNFGTKIYQLTWQDKVCIVYEEHNLKKLREFAYKGEGWGLTSDKKSLIMSDGSNTLKFINPENFNTVNSIEITDEKGYPVYNLNELEYIDGKIWANIWTLDKIIVIDPDNGKVIKEYNMSGLRKYLNNNPQAEVLNGIAYNAQTDTYFITGKDWGKIFEVKFK